MENAEEILHSLEEFSKLKPKDIPRELEDYLCFVAKTGDPVYQWASIKSLLREKLINVITDFYESCPSIEIPPCPNVEVFNYESMKTFILDKLDTFPAAPFTVQRICELLTSPRKQYNRIDKYMRALEKNILVVSTTEPGCRRSTENGDGIVNGLESDHLPESNTTANDINVEEMDDSPVWPRLQTESFQSTEANSNSEIRNVTPETISTFCAERTLDSTCGSTVETVITCRTSPEQPYVSIEPVASDSCLREESIQDSGVTVTITAIPAAVQKRRDSIEPVVSSADESIDLPQPSECGEVRINEEILESTASSTSSEVPATENTKSEVELECDNSVAVDNLSEIIIKDETDEINNGSLEITQSSPLIQIPIISEISSGVTCDEVEEVDTIPISNTKNEDTLHSDDVTLNPPIIVDTILDTAADVSTTVTSTVETEELKTVICENAAIVSPVSQETSVSSTDDLSNDASDVVLNVNQVEETSEVKPYDSPIPEDALSDCTVDTNSGIIVETEESNHSDDVAFNNEEYASSSTCRESMEVDIEEETCQEAATTSDV